MSVEIRKGKNLVSNIFGVISDLKETNLTASLGYLIGSFPEFFSSKLLSNCASILSVDIEKATKDNDRFDIVLNCLDQIVVIEAKIGINQNSQQINRYIKNLRASGKKKVKFFILDKGSFNAHTWLKDLVKKTYGRVEIEFLTREYIHSLITELLRSKRAIKVNRGAYHTAQDFNIYLEEEGMVKIIRKEVYTRDVSGHSIDLFFKHQIYKCQPKFYKSASGNAYFAPYFTGRAPKDFLERSLIRIEEGISWISPIIDTQLIKRNEVKDYLKAKLHPDHAEAAKNSLSLHKESEMTILLLGKPFLVFLTPISKKKLGLNGAMGSRSLSFEELFQAAGKA